MNSTTDRIVCHCLQVTESDIRTAIVADCVREVVDVMRSTGAGTGCTACRARIQELVAQHALKAEFVSHHSLGNQAELVNGEAA